MLVRSFASVAKTLEGPLARYEALVKARSLRDDGQQRLVAGRLQTLFDALTARSSYWPRWLRASRESVRGCYIHGDVGTGKTMAMDLFHNTLPPEIPKRRVHFHAFILEVHKRAHQLQATRNTPVDTQHEIVQELAQEAKVLCFDEFQVTDIGDAMILRNLLTGLFSRGVTIVMTSNRHPDELYKNGIQRASFLPCITLIKEKCEVIDLNSGIDYRRREQELAKVYFHPITLENNARLERIWSKLTNGYPVSSITLSIPDLDRSIFIPLAVPSLHIARFNFDDLCLGAMGPADYLTLVDNYHTIFLTDIPKMSLDRRMEARRFITLLDAVYERKATLICTAETSIMDLFTGDTNSTFKNQSSSIQDLSESINVNMIDLHNSPLFSGEEEIFAFQRAVSRLLEIQGIQWLQTDVRKKLLTLNN